jgi:hypothetical protein
MLTGKEADKYEITRSCDSIGASPASRISSQNVKQEIGGYPVTFMVMGLYAAQLERERHFGPLLLGHQPYEDEPNYLTWYRTD